ncbi:MAG: hypothetical protein LBE82_03675 [Chitinophagaceae bacterium]|nr:hypothetical protein [Chitinophagaceae bacterium]
MASIIIDIDNSNKASKIIDAIRLFKGVRKVTLEEKVRYPHLDNSIKEIKEKKVTRCKSFDELLETLNS